MEEDIPTLEDGHAWSDYIFEKWEEEGKTGYKEDFAYLIHTLPQIYETIELFGYHRLAKKIQKSVSNL